MTHIFVPSSGPGDWRCFLADPVKQWKRGYSARTLAHAWEDAEEFPEEISCLFAQTEQFAGIKPLLIFPEWKVELPGGSRPSQNDIWILAKGNNELVSIAVEGKVDESFDKTLGEWKADASRGKEERLEYLAKSLGLREPISDTIRYQFLHRAASAVIEAKRFGARHAVMVVHSFSKSDTGFPDFAEFVKLFGMTAVVGKLTKTAVLNNPSLYLAWVRGDERYLQS